MSARASFKAIARDPSVAKVHGSTTGGGTPVLSDAAYNVSSVVDAGVGTLTVNFAVPFATADYAVVAMPTEASSLARQALCSSKSAGSMVLLIVNNAASASAVDPTTGYNFACFGDQ